MKRFKDWGIRRKLVLPLLVVVGLGGGGIFWALMEMHDEIMNDALPEERAIDGIRRASLHLLSEYHELMLGHSEAVEREIDEFKEEIEVYEAAFAESARHDDIESGFVEAIDDAEQSLKRIGDEAVAARFRLLGHMETMESFNVAFQHLSAGDPAGAEPAEDRQGPELDELAQKYISELREYVLLPNDTTRREIAEIERYLEGLIRAHDDRASEPGDSAQDADEFEPARLLLEAGRVTVALTTEFLAKRDDLEGIHNELLTVLDNAGTVIAQETDKAFEYGFISVAGLILAVLAMITVVGFLVSQGIARPVTLLANAVNRFGAGDLLARADVGTKDEIGGLAIAFNQMAESLESNVERRERAEKDLKSLNAELEQRVEQRTAELREAQEALLRKSRLAALGQLTGTVSHELRNPLGALRASIAAIRKLAPGDQEIIQRSIALADRSVTRCDEIISDLLEYSRVRPLNRTEVALDDWLPTVLDEIELPAGVELAGSLDCGLELSLDPDRLRRVVLNLVDNACQAMTAGDEGADENQARERRLAVSTRATDARVELRIADTGPGIDAETLAKIFEPLYSTKTFGVGLGLTVVKQIMEQHGGGVAIDSTPGQGTEVVLWLPLPELARKTAS